MRILLADDHRLLLEGLTNLLEAYGHKVVATASDGFEALARTRIHRPDVVLMDVRMPRCDGLAATRLIKAELPETRIVMLTTSADDEDLFEAVRSGASGYLLKSATGDELVEALTGLDEGVPPFSPGLASRLLVEFARRSAAESVARDGPPQETARQPPGPVDAVSGPPIRRSTPKTVLTERQVEVLRSVAAGHTYKEAGAELGLSERTVRYHMAEIMERLHLEHRSQVIAYAGKAGLIGRPEE